MPKHRSSGDAHKIAGVLASRNVSGNETMFHPMLSRVILEELSRADRFSLRWDDH